MAHVFLSLDQIGQASKSPQPPPQPSNPEPQPATPQQKPGRCTGACQLVLAVTAARDNDRAAAHRHLDLAREVADKVGDGRDDYGTEFGPVNVAIHAVSVAVGLGDAIHDLQQAEKITPELIHGHHGARLVTRELLQLSGLHPRPELRDLAERFGVLP